MKLCGAMPSSRPHASTEPPAIALVKEPKRQARGSLQLAYKLEDDYGVTEARANFALPGARPDSKNPDAPRPLFEPPQFSLTLPNARTRAGVGQTVKDLSADPYAGAEVTLTLTDLPKPEAWRQLGQHARAVLEGVEDEVAAMNELFRPDPVEVAVARATLAEWEQVRARDEWLGVIAGEMPEAATYDRLVDRRTVRRARAILAYDEAIRVREAAR